MKYVIFSAGLAAVMACSAAANTLDLSYSVVQNGSLYDYSFVLSIDPGYSLQSGDGWTWIIFGDSTTTSPLTNFALTSAPPPPFGGVTTSGGGHNGPTFLDDAASNMVFWTPTSTSDTLVWAGTSTNNLGQGQLLYSELLSQNNAPADSFAVATLQSVPEPAEFAGLAAAALGLLWSKRRK